MEPELRKGADARLLLEVTLLQNMSQAMPAAASVARPAPAASLDRKLPAAVRPDVEAAAAATAIPAGAQVAAGGAIAAPAGADARWEALKSRLPKPVGSLLMDARLASVRDGQVRVEFRYPAHAELMQKASNRETLLAAVREVFGPDARLELAAADKPAPPVPAQPARSTTSIADDPLVKEAMNRFDATNVRVTPRGRA
jgi:hypothetical protein